MNSVDLDVQNAIAALSGNKSPYQVCRVITQVIPTDVKMEYNSHAHMGGYGDTTITCKALYGGSEVQNLITDMYKNSSVGLRLDQMKRYALVEIVDQ